MQLTVLMALGAFVVVAAKVDGPVRHGPTLRRSESGSAVILAYDVATSKRVSTTETAMRQLSRLFSNQDLSDNQSPRFHEAMSFYERIVRISVSWILLFLAKSLLLVAPLYYRKLIDTGSEFADLHARGMTTSLAAASAMGLILGYGGSRFIAGVVQLISEILLSPATTVCAEGLPLEAFACALVSSARRSDEPSSTSNGGAESKGKLSAIAAASGGQDEGRSGFARRALDRGLRASNQFLYRAIFSLLPALVEGLAVLVLICAKTSPAVGATAAAVATVFVALSGAVMKARIPIMRRLLQQEGTANGYAEDALSLAETVAAFGATEQEISRYASALAGVSRAAITVRFSFSALKMMQASLLGLGACCIAFVTWKEATHQLLAVSRPSSVAGQLILVQALFAQLCAPLDHMGQHFRDCVSAAEDLRELECIKAAGATSLEKQARLADDVTAAAAAAANKNRQDAVRSKAAAARPPPRLELRDLHFAYAVDPRPREDVVADTTTAASATTTTTTSSSSSSSSSGGDSERAETERVILRGISFSVPSGGYSVGIVGPSGSGKSTLLRVLLGLESVTPIGSNTYVTSSSSSRGQLLVDGVDVTSRHRVPLFSMVGQESDLFRSLDLAGNVRYGTKSAPALAPPNERLSTSAESTADLRALSNAARDAQLEPLLSGLPGGWNAAVGPRGRLLSGGERQRVCLARALYRQELTGGILLMDEVTASLDAQTESLVTRAILGRVKQGATAVLIAHRLSSVRDCDLILVLRDGVVVERGSHSQLMRKGGWYAQSVRLQRDS